MVSNAHRKTLELANREKPKKGHAICQIMICNKNVYFHCLLENFELKKLI